VQPEGSTEVREAVLAVVRAFFGDPDAEGLVAGPLAEWSQLVGRADAGERPDRFVHERVLESAEMLELRERHAVVDVRAFQRGRLIRGTWSYELRFDGPTVLERLDEGWRIVDLTQDRRRRLTSIVRGPLAEQQRPGVTLRVLGVDRCTRVTQFVVELANGGDVPIRVDQAYGLFETETMWARLAPRSKDPVPSGETATMAFTTSHALRLEDPVAGLALRVRAGRRKLPFLVKVPLTAPPAEVVPQRPPHHLPLLRRTWPRQLLFYAAGTAVTAWWLGEVAVLFPVFVGVALYLQFRNRGGLPDPVYRLRYALDVLVAVVAVALLWETVPVFAVPAAAGVAVFAVLWRVARGRRELRLVAALTVGAAWLFLLGGYDQPLSPCRIGDGSPAAAADGHVRRALMDHAAPRELGPRMPRLDDDAVAEIVRSRSSGADAEICPEVLGGGNCFEYSVPVGRRKTLVLAFVSCGGTHWDARATYFG
jgi:hypothetical protein